MKRTPFCNGNDTTTPSAEQIADETIAMLIEKLGAAERRVNVLTDVIEGVVMFPDVRNYIHARYPGLVVRMKTVLENLHNECAT